MPLDLVRTSEPAETPVSLAEVKAHLKVTTTSQDAVIGIYLAAAVSALDGYAGLLGRCMVEQTWKLRLPAFPCGPCIRLPLPPLVEVESVEYLDAHGAEQTLDPAAYIVLDGPKAEIRLADGAFWPATACDERAVSITFSCGYGAAGAVPAALKAAILLMVGDLYSNRETVSDVQMSSVPMSASVSNLIAPYRVLRV